VVHGHQSLHELLGYAPGEMPLDETLEWSRVVCDLVREFNTPPDDDKPPKPPRNFRKKGGLWVPE